MEEKKSKNQQAMVLNKVAIWLKTTIKSIIGLTIIAWIKLIFLSLFMCLLS